MSWQLFLAQLLNGLQFGVLLFLMSAGLTLVLGIMNFVNLMHGSLFMVGAYLAVATADWSGSFLLAMAAGVFGTLLVGLVVEKVVLCRLYLRDHLDQVLVTIGLLLCFNEVVRVIWGAGSLSMDVPQALSHTIMLFGVQYPAYRFAIIVVGLLVALGLYLLVNRTPMGLMIRAGASKPRMASALGINTRRLNQYVIGIGAALAGLAGLMAAPISSVQTGMGEPILVMALVVIVTGGIGSIRGAFYSALVIGVIDTVGRIFVPLALNEVFDRATAQAAGPALASIMIYLVMAAVLVVFPRGLFPVKHG